MDSNQIVNAEDALDNFPINGYDRELI